MRILRCGMIVAVLLLSLPAISQDAPARPDIDARIARLITLLDRMQSLIDTVQSRQPYALNAIRHFQFTYTFEPKGERYWSQIAPAEWIEKYSTGEQTRFSVTGRTIIDGDSGVIVRRADRGLEVFIPDTGSHTLWARFRSTGQNDWNFLGAMSQVQSDADRFYSVNLVSAANAPIDHVLALPSGSRLFSGIPFTVLTGPRSAIATRGSFHEDYPTKVTLTVDTAQALTVHLLLNGTYVRPEYRGRQAGTVELEFTDGQKWTVPIVAYQTLRETWAYEREEPRMDPPPSGVLWKNVYREHQDRGGAAVGYVDRMSLVLPENLRAHALKAITLTDTSDATVGSPDPGLVLMGITIEVGGQP